MAKDIFNRNWIVEKSLNIIERYEKGELTLRGLHYQLVAIGMTNTLTHYKRVVAAMIQARWDGIVGFDTFSDHDRAMIGKTEYEETFLTDEIETAKENISAWMNYYNKNKWENQPYYVEVFIEKKALQGVFAPICRDNKVALGACKGYPSLTFLNDAKNRFLDAEQNGKTPIMLYFGDYDPTGEDIPRSIHENLQKMGCSLIQVERIALMEHQVVEWNLPPAPVKIGDSRANKWTGLGQVELDAVEPKKLKKMCEGAILSYFNFDLYDDLKEVERKERAIYQKELKEYVGDL